MTGWTLVVLCAAERVDGAFGDDEGVEVFPRRRRGRRGCGFRRSRSAAPRLAGRFRSRCGVWRCRVPGGAEVGRGVCGVSEPVADVGEGEAAPDHEVNCGSVVVVVACGEVDPVAVVAAPGDELGQSGRAQHGVCAGRGPRGRGHIPHAAAMVSKGMRLMTSKSTRYGLFRFTPDAPGVAVDGDERGVVDQAVDGACDDLVSLPPRHGNRQAIVSNGKTARQKNEWRNGKDATPYQARPRNRARNQGKINRRRILPRLRYCSCVASGSSP